jgi:RNA polymerase sigma-70 factor (ECF subfamily)
VSPHTHQVKDPSGTSIAFEQLYDEHFQGILRYTLHRVGNLAEAQDLTAQTFFKALRGLWRFRWSGGSFSAWLYRIATNEVNSHLRRRRPTAPVEFLDSSPDSALSPLAQETASAEQQLSRNEMFQRLSHGLQRLKPEDQTMVVLRYVEEKPYREIASILRKRVGAVTMATRRALDRLKLEMDRQEEANGPVKRRAQEHARPAGPTVPADAAP